MNITSSLQYQCKCWLLTTDPSKRVTRCKPWSSYYHSLRVVIQRNMSIRKSVASGLNKAAKALEQDRSKEKIGKAITVGRVMLANMIMPKQAKYPTK